MDIQRSVLILKQKADNNPRRTVLIPLVELGAHNHTQSSSKNQLLEVYTESYLFGTDVDDLDRQYKSDHQAINKDWDRVAAPLRKIGLYQAGCVAASAVRKLGLTKPKMALYQWFKPQAWLERQRLHPGLFYPQRTIQGHSAELGLALVLLMGASGSPVRKVIATGALNGQTQVFKERDVKVLPVSNLAEKFQLVIQLVKQNQLTPSKEWVFFIPKYYQQGEPEVEIEQMPEVQMLRDLGIQVIPVAWLSEAAKILKATQAKYLWQDYLLRWFMVGLLVISLSLGSWIAWRDRAINMKFVSANQILSEEPFLVCDTDQHVSYQPIRREGIVPVIPVTSTLAWQIKIDDVNYFDSLLNQWLGYRGYYIAYLMISEFSAPMVRVLDDKGKVVRILPDQEWRWSWKLNDRAEENMLILLIQRHAFNLDELNKLLVKSLDSETTKMPINVTKIANTIWSQFPNRLSFTFRTIASQSQCTL